MSCRTTKSTGNDDEWPPSGRYRQYHGTKVEWWYKNGIYGMKWEGSMNLIRGKMDGRGGRIESQQIANFWFMNSSSTWKAEKTTKIYWLPRSIIPYTTIQHLIHSRFHNTIFCSLRSSGGEMLLRWWNIAQVMLFPEETVEKGKYSGIWNIQTEKGATTSFFCRSIKIDCGFHHNMDTIEILDA